MSALRRCDIAIVGAGPVGAGLAAALADSPFDVALLDAGEISTDWPAPGAGVDGYDSRTSAINERTRRFLASLGVWDELCGQRLCALARVSVWDGQGAGALDFSADELGEPQLGHIVENRLLTTALLRRAQRAGNVETAAGDAVRGLARLDGGALRGVLTERGDTVLARLVAVADGAGSPLRRLAGFRAWERDWRQRAIVATVRTERAHRQVAAQRFIDTGPVAFLPLGGDERACSVVWTVPDARAAALLALDDDAFRSELARAFEWRLGEVLEASGRLSFALRCVQAARYVQPGVALVGDAAHAVHPLAGQGINFGLHDAATLAAELALSGIGAVALKRYERSRWMRNMLAGAALDGIRLAFAQPRPAAGWLRDAGMRGIDRAPAIKRLLARQAMGI